MPPATYARLPWSATSLHIAAAYAHAEQLQAADPRRLPLVAYIVVVEG